jgi:succinate-semialdehyde dehydrogenase / glutarate-semialdehyde dehydrogenase
MDILLPRPTDVENTPAISKELCTNPLVRKISFTGSTNVGKHLMSLSSSTIKRLSLELGGNAPFLVFDDAFLDQAVEAAMSSKFRNAGQTCVCADRFLVQRNIYEEFLEKLAQTMDRTIVVGNGLHPKTTMGPLISAQSRDRVHTNVQAALLEGAEIVRGGVILESLPGYFYAPTLLRDVSVESDIWKTETFGPVAAVRPFETEEEAIAIANDSNFGLASYVMTRDLGRTFRVSKALEAGMVAVNDGILSTCTAPFGGIKESGLGREGSTAGLYEYLETKYVFINY